MSFTEVTEKQKKVFVIIIVISIILLCFLYYFPTYQVSHFGITDPKDLADAENNYRATLAQILGGGAIAIGIYFAWGNLKVAQKGQIIERFSKAVEHL